MIWGAVGPPWWDDRVTVVIGGGPSLSGFDPRAIPDRAHIVGVNQAMLDFPCEAGISIDFGFVARNQVRLAEFAESRPLYLAVSDRRPERMPAIQSAVYLRSVSEGLSGPDDYSSAVVDGGTSGFAALQLAVLKRARHIVLLGFDYGLQGDRDHYHDAYVGHGAGADAATWQRWAENFNVIAPQMVARGIEVINASPASQISCFPKCSIEDALHAVS
ncbi:hypothetical protein ACE10Z_23615 [Bradyrhizobium sp. Pha-3]|uniref:hypothetical protein n=1 Tax=Bradyrhizobium sp. Pha-3 TaxID=208375 RepID=UPI0035D3FC05